MIFKDAQRLVQSAKFPELDVRGSVQCSTILTVKNPTRCTSVIKILLSLILN